MKGISRLFRYFVLIVFLVMTLAVCQKKEASQAGGSGTKLKDLDTSKEVEVIMYYTGDLRAKQQDQFDNFNRLAKAKINTTLKQNLLPTADYRTKYPLIFASGEAFDLAYAATWLNFSQLAKRGSFMAIENLAPKYAPKTYARQSRSAIIQATVDGHLYGLPSLVATYSAYGPVYRTDLVQGKGWNGKMDNLLDLEAYMDVIRANYPQMEPLEVTTGGSYIDDMFLYENGIYPLKGGTNDFLFIRHDGTLEQCRILFQIRFGGYRQL